jgi:glycosidase/MoaA/NifB/PqqE/SkfB family radical SAM enzyme
VRFPVRIEVPAGARLFGELGELGGWERPIAEGGASGATFEASLPAGLYRWKLRGPSGDWLAPSGRTRAVNGARDALLVVGGTEEPLAFAPAAPCVREAEDGTLHLLVALRRGHGERLRVRWREDPREGFHGVDATPFAFEDEHVVFRAVLPASAAAVELFFEIDDAPIRGAGGVDEPLRWTRPPRSERAPALGCVYTIFVDRFRRWPDPGGWGDDPGRDAPAGGNFDGITHSLDELRALGVDAVYLTPVQLAASCHRYDLVDPLRVDPALGGEEAFARLVEGAHARGLRVLLDFSFVHVGRGFPPYEDVLSHGRGSRFAAWFQWREDGRVRCYGRRDDAALLDLDHPEVRALALQTVERLAGLGVDGFRFDAVADVPVTLARAVRERLRAIRHAALVLGEIVPENAWRWRAEGAIDLASDFAFHALATDFVAKRAIDAAAFAEGLRRAEVTRGLADERAVRFLSTHDHPRFASLARLFGDGRSQAARAELGLLLLLSWPGVPAILYGEELGLASRDPVLEPEHAWGDRMPMPWGAGPSPTRALVSTLLALRAREPALRRGALELLHAEGPLLIARRRDGGDVLDLVIHAGDEPLEVSLEDDERALLEPLAQVGEIRVTGASVVLGPNAGVLARRRADDAQRARRAALISALPVLRDRDFAQGRLATAARPTRLDVAVTERCNLRCAHCLALAPERTAGGTARTMGRAVLDRLRDDFAYASWFGFVHGGESLTTPMLWEALAAIRRARAGAKTTIHLLTNGKLLSRATAEKLIAAGVNSLFVSLDGATAEVNDRVRIGGDFQAICANVRAAVALRRDAGADLRIGLSLVVMRANAAQLVPFVELAAALGVDWIKLEEPVAATPFAAEQMVDVSASAIATAIDEACARARALGLVAVDHTRGGDVWRCALDERGRAFLEADGFANRIEMHPCRAPWERACVFPNGDVAIDDFLRPVVGNVLARPLAELWNDDAAQAARAAARARWICGGRPSCVG